MNRDRLSALVASAHNVHTSKLVQLGELDPKAARFMRPADAATFSTQRALILLRAYLEYVRDPANCPLFTVEEVEGAIRQLQGE